MPSASISQPVGHLVAAGGRDVDLAGGGGGGRHVEHQRAVQVGRDGEADRVGAQPGLGAAEGCDGFGLRPELAVIIAIMPSAGGEQRVAGEAADMALAEHRGGGDVLRLRLFDRVAHRPVGDRVAKAPVAVDDGCGRRFPG